MTQHFEYLSHTADVKVRASGKDAAEAFVAAAKACTNVIVDVVSVQKKVTKPVSFTASSIERLLYDYLNFLVYLKDTKHFVAVDGSLTFFAKPPRIEGELIGDVLAQYDTHGDVKAATYHDMKFIQEADRCVLEFVLDI